MSDPNVADQKMAELREKFAGQFSEREINDFVNMGEVLASKTVLTVLKETVRMGTTEGQSKRKAEALCAQIDNKMKYTYCGYISLTFNETPMVLNVQLSLADRDYRTEIDIPNAGYAHDLCEKYIFLKKIAIAYWHTFQMENQELLAQIAEFRKDVDFTKLQIENTHQTTMYWDHACPKRIGIFCYYVDPAGKAYFKRSKK